MQGIQHAGIQHAGIVVSGVERYWAQRRTGGSDD
jgi:hypothetical protein